MLNNVVIFLLEKLVSLITGNSNANVSQRVANSFYASIILFIGGIAILIVRGVVISLIGEGILSGFIDGKTFINLGTTFPAPPIGPVSLILGSLISSFPFILLLLGVLAVVIAILFIWVCNNSDIRLGNLNSILKGLAGCPDAGGIGEGGFGIGEDPCSIYKEDTLGPEHKLDESGQPILNEDGSPKLTLHKAGSATGAFSINGVSGCWTCPDNYVQNRKVTSLKCSETDHTKCQGYQNACIQSVYAPGINVKDRTAFDLESCTTLSDGRKAFKSSNNRECVVCPIGTEPVPIINSEAPYKCKKVEANHLGKAVDCKLRYPGSFRHLLDCYKCPAGTERIPGTKNCGVAVEPIGLSGCSESNPNIDSTKLYPIGIKGCGACPEGYLPNPILGDTLTGPLLKKSAVACIKDENGNPAVNIDIIKGCIKQGQDISETIQCIQETKKTTPKPFTLAHS